MLLNYNILTTIDIKHDYVDGEALKSIGWLPSEETARVAKNLGLSFKSTNGRLTILASSYKENGKVYLGEKLRDPFFLTFYIQFNDALWSNYTPLSASKTHKFFFSNRLADDNPLVSDEMVGMNNLVQTSHVGQILLSNQDFKELILTKLGESENHNYAIKQELENSIINGRILDEGYYELSSKDDRSTFFLKKDKTPCDGILHLLVNPESELLVQTDCSFTPSAYSIHFPVKETKWRYIFTKEKLEELQGIRILNGVKEAVFNEGEDVNINGLDMLRFTSNSPIALKEKTGQHFQLRKNVGIEDKSEGVIISRLPSPDKTTLYRVENNGEQYSDIYINF